MAVGRAGGRTGAATRGQDQILISTRLLPAPPASPTISHHHGTTRDERARPGVGLPITHHRCLLDWTATDPVAVGFGACTAAAPARTVPWVGCCRDATVLPYTVLHVRACIFWLGYCRCMIWVESGEDASRPGSPSTCPDSSLLIKQRSQYS